MQSRRSPTADSWHNCNLGAASRCRVSTSLLPVGTVIQGKVVGSAQLTDASGRPSFQIAFKLLDTPLSGQTMLIESSRPLALGSLMTAQVQGGQALNFIPLGGLLDQLQLSQHLAAQQGRQASLEGVFHALQGMGNNLPENLRSTVSQLLGLVPDVEQLGDPKTLAQTLSASGVFLEARLLAGLTGSAPADVKALLLRLLAQLPTQPTSTPQLAAQSGAGFGQALPAFARQALGALGQANAQQLALNFPLGARLPAGMEEEADLEMLLKLAAAAVSRLQTHQLSSLAQTHVTPDGSQLTTWQLELPMRDRQDIVPLQIKLQRETPARENSKEQPEPLWRVELAFDLAPLGRCRSRLSSSAAACPASSGRNGRAPQAWSAPSSNTCANACCQRACKSASSTAAKVRRPRAHALRWSNASWTKPHDHLPAPPGHRP